jgi:mRNA-degrading endonuclease RelE of RelBE toxin-antitoxin system
MKAILSDRVINALERVPPQVRRAFLKQVDLLVKNLAHPSLKAKKYDQAQGVWQARVNRSWRFYFTIEGSNYKIEALMTHPK